MQGYWLELIFSVGVIAAITVLLCSYFTIEDCEFCDGKGYITDYGCCPHCEGSGKQLKK